MSRDMTLAAKANDSTAPAPLPEVRLHRQDRHYCRTAHSMRSGTWPSHELVRPADEVFEVGHIGVPALVLAPGELTIQHADADIGLLGILVVIPDAQVARA